MQNQKSNFWSLTIIIAIVITIGIFSYSNAQPPFSQPPGQGQAQVVHSVSNTDGTLTIAPTTGNVTASLNLGNSNTWLGSQIFNVISAATGTINNLVSDVAVFNVPLKISSGGTGANNSVNARANLGTAASGTNTDITSIALTATSTINGSPICTAVNGACAALGTPSTAIEQFGDGSDGDVIISANTNLIRDMYYNNLTLNSGAILFTKNFRIYVKNTLTNNGTIDNSGSPGGNGTNAGAPSAGGGGSGGLAIVPGSLPAGLSGIAGSAGGDGGTFSPTAGNPGSSGSAGLNQKMSLGLSGNNGNSGGNGGTCFNAGGTGGVGGTGGLVSVAVDPLKNVATAYQLFDFLPMLNLNNSAGSGGSGGGGGGRGGQGLGGGGGGGGGSGSGGGTISIFAKNILNNGVIRAEGGVGGNGGNGGNAQINAGGGGGGGAGTGGSGGIIILIYKSKIGGGSVSILGGAAGTPGLFGLQAGGCGTQGSTGGSSQSGAPGKIYELQL